MADNNNTQHIVWHDDAIIKQLISYAVGCMLGRYRLGKPLEQYFVKDFWKDHKKMYQNRPIYWLFSSKKGAFQVIAYMHRMNAYTAERVRRMDHYIRTWS